MAFTNYLEDENDKPYFNKNSLAYYYDKMEGFAEKVEQAAKILNVTKEEVEKNITAYIEQNKNELDQRLAQWDGKLETFDSSVETLLTEWVDDGTLTPLIDSTLIDQRIAPVASQLAETAKKSDLQGLSLAFKESYSTLSALQAAYPTGNNYNHSVLSDGMIYTYKNGWISTGIKANGTGVADGTLTVDKLAFTKVTSKNIFNKATAFNGFLNSANGEYIADPEYYSSSLMKVQPGETIKFKNGVSFYALFGSNNSFINGEDLSTSILELKIPANVYGIKITFYYTNLNTFMAAIDTLPTVYEEFSQGIDAKYIETKPVKLDDIPVLTSEKIGDGIVTPAKLDGYQPGKNLLNVKKSIVGKYLETNGTLTTNELYSTTEKISVVAGEPLVVTKLRAAAYYDNNGIFISYVSDASYPTNYVLNPPVGAKTVQISYKTSDAGIMQLEKGSVATSYVTPGYKVAGLVIDENNIIKTSVPSPAVVDVINLPSTLYATVGTEFNIYTSNILKHNEDLYNVNYDSSFGRQEVGRFTVTPTQAGTRNLTVEVFEKEKLVATKTVSIVVSSPRTSPITIVLKGDSTVRANGYGYVTKRLKDKLANNIELVGTMGTSPNMWEGRGGWTAANYRSNLSYEGVANPFYNPATNDFDIRYYLENLGIASIDVFIINLGINDVYSYSSDAAVKAQVAIIQGHIDFIIGNIKSFNPAIKVALNITIPPNASQLKFGEQDGANGSPGQTQWRYKYNNFIYVAELIKKYDGTVPLISIHANINTKTNIADHVHPVEAGYNQIGDAIYSYLNTL